MFWTIAAVLAVIVLYRTLRGWIDFLFKGEHLWWASQIKTIAQELAVAGFSGASDALCQAAKHFEHLDTEWKDYAQRSHQFLVARQQLRSIQALIKLMNDAASSLNPTDAAVGASPPESSTILRSSADQLCADVAATQIKLTALGLNDSLTQTRSFASRQVEGQNAADGGNGLASEGSAVSSNGVAHAKAIREGCAATTEEVLMCLNQLEILDGNSYQEAVQSRSKHCDEAIRLLQSGIDAQISVVGALQDRAATLSSLSSDASRAAERLESIQATNPSSLTEEQEEAEQQVASCQMASLAALRDMQACLSAHEQGLVVGVMAAPGRAQILALMTADARAAVLRSMAIEQKAAVLGAMSFDEQTAALQMMSAEEEAAAVQAIAMAKRLRGLSDQVQISYVAVIYLCGNPNN